MRIAPPVRPGMISASYPIVAELFDIIHEDRELLVINSGGFLLMIPWVWWRGHGLPAVIYVVAMNVVFWIARTSELRQYFRLRREGKLRNLEDAIAMMDMGRGMGRIGKWLGLNKSRKPLEP